MLPALGDSDETVVGGLGLPVGTDAIDVGATEGDTVGSSNVGNGVVVPLGLTDGREDGIAVPNNDGFDEGLTEGPSDGSTDTEGCSVGLNVGFTPDGLGVTVGSSLGFELGVEPLGVPMTVGNDETDGSVDGTHAGGVVAGGKVG